MNYNDVRVKFRNAACRLMFAWIECPTAMHHVWLFGPNLTTDTPPYYGSSSVLIDPHEKWEDEMQQYDDHCMLMWCMRHLGQYFNQYLEFNAENEPLYARSLSQTCRYMWKTSHTVYARRNFRTEKILVPLYAIYRTKWYTHHLWKHSQYAVQKTHFENNVLQEMKALFSIARTHLRFYLENKHRIAKCAPDTMTSIHILHRDSPNRGIIYIPVQRDATLGTIVWAHKPYHVQCEPRTVDWRLELLFRVCDPTWIPYLGKYGTFSNYWNRLDLPFYQ